MMTSADIRKQFLDFFAGKGHQIVPSAPIVVKNDPSLLFTNAGMNQFKDYFLGNRKPEFPCVADTQKCLRVSGKHNDLEEVGVDTYHHTMFEMLGNWSFGDPEHPESGYFKEKAIAWSWELLTSVYGLDKDRLYVTIFEGDEKEGLPGDAEAYDEWKKHIPEDRILKGKKKDNFWEMGDTGPCGPCTEIHVDCRTESERSLVDGKTLVNNDHPQVIEIWNNVFIQFNRLKNGSLEPLPARHVDTGMGFERLVRVIQGKQSNYDTDVFTGTLQATENISGKKYTASESRQDIAFRVLADHIRAIAFTIADGQLPSNTGAGYVIRRILRRAVRYYYSYLDYKQPLLFQLLPVIAKQFEQVFPELQHQLDFVSRVVKEEEEAFLKTLEKGLKRMDDILAESKTEIPGKAAFELFDTFGFPIDLTRLIASENKRTVDEPGFEAEMQQQKTRSRAASAVDAGDWTVLIPDSFTEFVGYDSLETGSRLVKYRSIKTKGKQAFQLVLDATPFYAESGGQAGDTGTLSFGEENIIVTDTRKENNLVIHITESLPDNLESGVIARVDRDKRGATAIHHSATHLLHAALRKVLGNHVAQKGSLVQADHLRFDFSHFAKLSEEEIKLVETIVNEKIRENIPVYIKEMPRNEAIAMGAMALFGEKYGDVVRVVIMDPKYSIELCGGTHVGNTGEIGSFYIKHESAVAAGVRRVEAVAGAAAETYIREQLSLLQEVKELLKQPKDLLKSLENMQQEHAELRKKLESMEARHLGSLAATLAAEQESINGIRFVGSIVEAGSPDSLKKLCFDLKSRLENNYAIILAASIDGKAQVALMLDEVVSEQKQIEAPALIKQHIAGLIKGGGGGQKTLATAGGQDASNLPLVIDRIRSLLL